LEDLLRDPEYTTERGRDKLEEAAQTREADIGPAGPMHCLTQGKELPPCRSLNSAEEQQDQPRTLKSELQEAEEAVQS